MLQRLLQSLPSRRHCTSLHPHPHWCPPPYVPEDVATTIPSISLSLWATGDAASGLESIWPRCMQNAKSGRFQLTTGSEPPNCRPLLIEASKGRHRNELYRGSMTLTCQLSAGRSYRPFTASLAAMSSNLGSTWRKHSAAHSPTSSLRWGLKYDGWASLRRLPRLGPQVRHRGSLCVADAEYQRCSAPLWV